ncbi:MULTISPECIES: DUF6362 family protein [Ralstonia solanacearum species complex]|uniref:Uncharacterized protein n=5 Tax=Ralstonia solanacearum species complex TaxID=3116862 RepID=A0A0K1ZRB8_RALSL|nr:MULTISPECIES: DUF6362 family protein [Ralstonia]AKZ28553.1 hypothetical protein ACH51_19650 [Ralstonia solanacearum]AVV67486.1 hypothetical protein RSOE_02415 [Ralstonia solanacearum OE1-1]API77139.1 hypothetical protein AC251_21345 [Ralstonia pseudosolanacearum]AST88447.1 hypothetical protein CIG66_18445 [Ralstonia pseudosolanacearum]AUS44692.1 hypothetical protein CYD94_21340 [Ralstonia solanacearum]
MRRCPEIRGQIQTGSSEAWTPDSVAARFEEAARTGRTLPPVRVQGYFRVWPHIVREQWERLAADDQPRHYYPPSPAAIDRMLETMRWVQWLDVDHRPLVWMRAQGDEWRYIAKRYACCVKTVQRRWQRAMQTVVDRLNGGKQVGRV